MGEWREVIIEDITNLYQGLAINKTNRLLVEKFTLPYTYFIIKLLMDEIKQFNDFRIVFSSIKKTDFENIEIPLPTNDSINEFHNITSSFNEKIIQNINPVKTLENMRDILLSKLMSGEVRVQN